MNRDCKSWPKGKRIGKVMKSFGTRKKSLISFRVFLIILPIIDKIYRPGKEICCEDKPYSSQNHRCCGNIITSLTER